MREWIFLIFNFRFILFYLNIFGEIATTLVLSLCMLLYICVLSGDTYCLYIVDWFQSASCIYFVAWCAYCCFHYFCK